MYSMGKESITLSMELAKTQCYKFKCFEDNYLLTGGGGGGGRDEVWDRETMFSQLAKRSPCVMARG